MADRICAIFSHYSRAEISLNCLRRLKEQTVRPTRIVIANNSTPDDPALGLFQTYAEENFPPGTLSIVQLHTNMGNAGGCAAAMNEAFSHPEIGYVWILDDDSWPRPDTLAQLLAIEDTAPGTDKPIIRMSLVVDPSRHDELSWPLTAREPSAAPYDWQNIALRADLPDTPAIPSRGGWLGALYPRRLWEEIGVPTPELFIRGEDEEYPWKARHAGYTFVTVRHSLLDHPTPPSELMHCRIGNRAFFYEPGLDASRFYYKVRNWAWLQRLKTPKNPVKRLLACGAYICLALHGMLTAGDCSWRKTYALFRGLHNGYYGHLRPY
ncbi:glycosyltransferase [Akkermansia glycaniphila]|uniref:Nucleotide-diphospho-sugar transferases n=1 Tax=Akkermansia glycaniphila TaxID=1679444 RepID=A0A1C7PCW2_9BACT|nr:glycosyltransferase family 2 protein [Akkermansia glycaniphila]OCA03298.1 hypothetical protein AC781_05375 [Akkermansia glycaniphila]SEH80998.1 nucleotide-diphospho-sugar transferases [Akkermansia glycaniphila]